MSDRVYTAAEFEQEASGWTGDGPVIYDPEIVAAALRIAARVMQVDAEMSKGGMTGFCDSLEHPGELAFRLIEIHRSIVDLDATIGLATKDFTT